jgi:prepilin-type N-terminal cleavage/methylation domain-containing protein
MRKQNGFGLIELMVSISIVLVLMTFAVVPLSAWLQVARQKRAITALRQIQLALAWDQQLYQNGYPPNLNQLSINVALPRTCDMPEMLPAIYTQTMVGDFQITYTTVGTVALAPGCTVPGGLNWFATATPTGFAGKRSFYVDNNGLRYQDNGTASVGSDVWTGQ